MQTRSTSKETYAIICSKKGYPMAFDQKRYIGEYNKAKYKMFPFRVRKDDEEVMNKLLSVPSMNRYIRSLIEHDIHPTTLTIKQIKERMAPVLKKWDIHEVYLFGSYARGEANNDSDVDIYCEHGKVKNLYDCVDIEDDLKAALGKDVDVVFIGSRMDDWFKAELDKDKIRLC